MRKYGAISTSLWGSKKWKRLGDAKAQLFYLYLHTCSHGNATGCFRLPLGYGVEDLGWPRGEVEAALAALVAVDLVRWDAEEQIVLLVDYLKHNPIASPNHAKSAVSTALRLPACPLRDTTVMALMEIDACRAMPALAQVLPQSARQDPGEALRSPFEGPSQALANTETNPDPGPDPNPDPGPDPSPKTEPEPSEVDLAVAEWNRICGPAGLPPVRLPNAARRKRLLARLKEAERLCEPGQSALDQWRLACTRLAASPFHTGQNGRGWRASFDFLLQPEQFAKALEDAFGGPGADGGDGAPGGSVRAHRRRTAAARAGQEERLKKLLEAQLSALPCEDPRQPSPPPGRPNAGPKGEPGGDEGGTLRAPDAPAQTSIPPPKETPPDERTS